MPAFTTHVLSHTIAIIALAVATFADTRKTAPVSNPASRPAQLLPPTTFPGSPTPQQTAPSTSPTKPIELLPGVLVNTTAKTVEFAGTIANTATETEPLFLEVLIATRDTREHEAIVMTDIRASAIHAALLALGLTPGTPGSIDVTTQPFTRTPPSGPPVLVELLFKTATGKAETINILSLVRNPPTPKNPNSPRIGLPQGALVFAGSRQITRKLPNPDNPTEFSSRTVYDADGMGTLVGLHTFSTETIAFIHVFSPDAAIDQPMWVADWTRLPPAKTPVTIRISANPAETPAPKP